jgi:hypothetical protein
MHPDEERGEEQQHPPIVLNAEPGTYGVKGSSAILWLNASFAQAWYEDALAEARADETFQHRRREILCAVCAVESYLLEWVRDTVLSRDFTALITYFPANRRRGITDKWKEVLKALYNDGLISTYPDLNTPVWGEFRTLVHYRDGLVHARVSRPEPDELPADWLRLSPRDLENLTPVPSKSARDTAARGWATRVVAHLITHLHTEIGTQPPAWLIEP